MTNNNRLLTGIPGFDEVLNGGLLSNRTYLIEGDPGTGKTTLALHFLLEGIKQGERCLYITLSESKNELVSNAKTHGFDLSKIDIFEIPSDDQFHTDSQNTFFHSAELELKSANEAILAELDRVKPQRVVFDSLSEMKLLSKDSARFRKQILSIKQHFSSASTVLLLDDMTATLGGKELQSIVHGVIRLESLPPEYGTDRRHLHVTKLRGLRYRGGYHDYIIEKGGIRVFPRLVADKSKPEKMHELLPSGIEQLDKLFAGGVHRGTSTLIMGPAGAGKSMITMQFIAAAAARGEKSEIFIFDESRHTALIRTAGVNIPLEEYIQKGLVRLTQIDPAEVSPGEFSGLLRTAVEEHGAKIICIDSLNGYLNAMPNEKFLLIQMHENLSYLGQMGVATFIVVAQHGLLGTSMETTVDVSYIADSVILLRFFEMEGEVRQAISVVKRRTGAHERSIREMKITSRGLIVGEPLRDFRGVLSGIPIYHKNEDTGVNG